METTNALARAISEAVARGDLDEVARLREAWFTADVMERMADG